MKKKILCDEKKGINTIFFDMIILHSALHYQIVQLQYTL